MIRVLTMLLLLALLACDDGLPIDPGSSTSSGGRVEDLVVLSGGDRSYQDYPVVRLAVPTAGAVIHYTFDGTTPTAASPVFQDSLLIGSSGVFKAVALKQGMDASGVLRLEFQLKACDPVPSLESGVYESYQQMTLALPIPGGQIRYTRDGSEPTEESPLYRDGERILVDTTTVFRMRSFRQGMEPSNVVAGRFELKLDSLAASARSGVRWERVPFAVALACGTPGAEIRYTLDGTPPTPSSALYTDSVPVHSGDTALWARVFHPTQPKLAARNDVRLRWAWAASGMKAISGGRFLSNGRSISVSSFLMDSTEVTQGSYAALTDSNPSALQGGEWLHPGQELKDKFSLPVENVSWMEAIRYCNLRSRMHGLDTVYTIAMEATEWGYSELRVHADFSKNGYRLPTEAEWEYAMRAGSGGRFHWGSDSSPAASSPYAWFDPFVGMGIGPHPVAMLSPNAWGLYDMVGNVHEWVNDWYGDTALAGGDIDPIGPPLPMVRRRHLSRGGTCVPLWSKYKLGVDPRGSWGPGTEERHSSVGFRCVRRP